MSTIAIDAASDALIIVDVQNDFCPGGALAVPRGDEVVPVLNGLLEYPWFTVATKDWHPAEHCSFHAQGGPWPPHCVQDTPGAQLHPNLHADKVQLIVTKGSELHRDAYSGFQGTHLAEILRRRGIKRVVVGGIATEYCVRATAHDALAEGFRVLILADAVRAVELQPGDGQRALDELRREGGQVVVSTALGLAE